jgi:hypothetical protein
MPNKLLAEDLHDFMDIVFAGKATLKVNGEPGAGKSKQAEAYARRQAIKYGEDGGYGLFIFDLSCTNLADLMGYLMPTTITDTVQGVSQEVLAARYTYPYWAYDYTTKLPAYKFKRGLIILEEWGQGDPEVKRACAPLINDGRLGMWRFEGFDIIVLSNRAEDRSGVTKEYDFTINRWVEVDLIATLNGFLAAGGDLGMTPLTLAYASRRTDRLFQAKVPEKQGPWMTQRSLHRFDDIIKASALKGIGLDHPLMLNVAVGAIGEADAYDYMAFAEARSKIPTISTIVADPEGAPIPTELDVLMFLVFDLASKTKRDNVAPIFKYVSRLKSDMGCTYFHAATRRDDTLVSTKEFSQFAIDNLTLLSAVAGRKAKR